jgi:hypothetical protein
MAIGDILEGLLAGAAGGFRGYSEFQQADALRKEREAEREAARLERQEAARRLQEQENRRFGLQVQQAVAEGILSPTEYVEYAEPSEFLRGEAIGMQRPAAGADMSSILADQPIGMQRQAPSRRSEIASALSAEARDGRMEGGAMVAPGQTYSAIDRVLAEAEPTPRAEDIGARDTERPARGLDRVLEITPEDIAGRFERAPMQGSWTGGRGTFEGLDGQMYRAVTPEERAEAQREAAQSELDAAAKEIAAIAKSQFNVDLSPEAAMAVARDYVKLENLIPKEPRTTAPTSFMQDYAFILQTAGQKAADDFLQSKIGGGADGMGGLSAGVQTMLFRMFEEGEPVMERDSSGELYDTGYRRPYTEERKREIIQGYRDLAKLMGGAGADAAQEGGGQGSRNVGLADFLSGGPLSATPRGTGERLMIGGGMPASGSAAISPEQARQLELGFRDTQREVVGPPPNIDFEALGIPRYSDEGPTVAEMVEAAAKVGKGIKGLVEGGYPVPQGQMFR